MERVRRNVRFMLADFIDFLVGVDPRCLSVLSLSFFLSVMCVRVCMYVCVCVCVCVCVNISLSLSLSFSFSFVLFFPCPLCFVLLGGGGNSYPVANCQWTMMYILWWQRHHTHTHTHTRKKINGEQKIKTEERERNTEKERKRDW